MIFLNTRFAMPVRYSAGNWTPCLEWTGREGWRNQQKGVHTEGQGSCPATGCTIEESET